MSYPYTQAVHFADVNGDGNVDYLYVHADGSVTVYLRTAPGWMFAGVFAPNNGARREEIRFADLDGDGKAEYLWVHPDSSVEAWQNPVISGSSISWTYYGVIATGIGRAGAGVRFADMNGDGLADYVHIGDDGNPYAYINTGALTHPTSAWQYWGPIGSGLGGGRWGTQLADLDGDGSADLIYVDPASSVTHAWQNQLMEYGVWAPLGQITGGYWQGDAMGVTYADLNGDWRADLMYVQAGTGAVATWINGCMN